MQFCGVFPGVPSFPFFFFFLNFPKLCSSELFLFYKKKTLVFLWQQMSCSNRNPELHLQTAFHATQRKPWQTIFLARVFKKPVKNFVNKKKLENGAWICGFKSVKKGLLICILRLFLTVNILWFCCFYAVPVPPRGSLSERMRGTHTHNLTLSQLHLVTGIHSPTVCQISIVGERRHSCTPPYRHSHKMPSSGTHKGHTAPERHAVSMTATLNQEIHGNVNSFSRIIRFIAWGMGRRGHRPNSMGEGQGTGGNS